MGSAAAWNEDSFRLFSWGSLRARCSAPFPATAGALRTVLGAGVGNAVDRRRNPESNRLPPTGSTLTSPLRIRHHDLLRNQRAGAGWGRAGSAAYPTAVPVQQAIAGLAPSTTYHYRFVASNSDGPVNSSDLQFTTVGPAPVVSDEAATEVSGTSFELKGIVNPSGSATTYQFEYGTTTSYGSKIPVPEASVGSGGADVPVTQTASGLLPNTTYHYRLTAHNPGNTATTGDKTFLTPPAPPSAPSAEVNAPEATLNGFLLKSASQPGQPVHYLSLRVWDDHLLRDQPARAGRLRRLGLRPPQPSHYPGSHRPPSEHDLPLPDRRRQLGRAWREWRSGVHHAAAEAGSDLTAGERRG